MWWEQHYEHRVLFPEAIFALDWYFLKGREILPLVLTAVLDFLVWIIFVSSRRKSSASPDVFDVSSLLIAGAIMFWPGVAFVLAFPYSLQFVLSQFCATAGYLMVARERGRVAAALGIIASFSSANGLFVWPLFLAIALSMRQRVAAIWPLIAGAGISIPLFFFPLS